MTWFWLVFGSIIVTAFAISALMSFLERFGGPVAISVMFLVVGMGAYAASFVIDMIVQVCAGTLFWSSVLLPCCTWSMISLCLLTISFQHPGHFLARAIPFWILGADALVGSLVHPWNLTTALAMLLAGSAYAWLAKPLAHNPCKG